MSTLDDAVGVWPAGSVSVEAAAVPLDRYLGGGRAHPGNSPGGGPAAGARPPVPFGDGAVGLHTGAPALVRRVHPGAAATTRLDPHDTAVLAAAVAEADDLHDQPDVR